MFINRAKYKPCYECKGVGKKADAICPRCRGYGSIGLKVVQQSLKKTSEGK